MATYLSQQNNIYIADNPLNENDILIPDKPSDYHVFDFNNKEWVCDLNNLKIIKLTEIIDSFDYCVHNNIGYYSNVINKVINSTREDLDNMKKLLDKMIENNQDTTLFRCFDDSFVNVTQDQLKSMIDELVDFGLYLYQKKWQYEGQILNATDISDIIDLEWSL